MADNYVSIRIKASDTAKPDLTDLKLKLDGFGHKVETARVDVDDADASVKLLRMNARLAELNAKTSNPRIKVAGAARAEAEILFLEHELDKLNRKADEAGPTGLLGKILSGADGGGGLAGMLPGGATLPLIAAAVPAVGAIAVELTGLVSGFAAAGAGAGAFALLALPAIDKVKKALTDTPAQLKKLGKLSPDEAGAVSGIKALEAEFKKLSLAFEPQAFKVFNDALNVAKNLLPAVTPMANAFANSLDGLLKHLGKFTQSKDFKDWLKKFTGDIGPAMTAIGNGIGKVAPALGKLLTLMSRKDVVNAINIAFTILADTIKIVTAGISRFMKNWDGMSSAVRRGSHDIASSFDSVRHFAASMAHDVAHNFDTMRHFVAVWVTDVARDIGQVVSFFLRLPGRVAGAVAGLPGMLMRAGINAIAGLLRGLTSEAGRVIGWVENFASNIAGAFGNILHIFSPSKVFEQHGKMIAAGLIQGMDGSHSLVTAAATRLARSTIPGQYPAQGAAGAAGGIATVQLEWVGGGSDELMRLIRSKVRVQGGDPSMFNRKVAFQ